LAHKGPGVRGQPFQDRRSYPWTVTHAYPTVGAVDPSWGIQEIDHHAPQRYKQKGSLRLAVIPGPPLSARPARWLRVFARLDPRLDPRRGWIVRSNEADHLDTQNPWGDGRDWVASWAGAASVASGGCGAVFGRNVPVHPWPLRCQLLLSETN